MPTRINSALHGTTLLSRRSQLSPRSTAIDDLDVFFFSLRMSTRTQQMSTKRFSRCDPSLICRVPHLRYEMRIRCTVLQSVGRLR